MSNPKRPSPEQLATQIATTVPGGRPQGPGDRRTAALPQAPVPLSAPTDRTMTFDPSALQQPRGRVPLPTMMSMPQARLPRAPFRLGRWVGGPLLAIVVCVLTTWLSGLIAPAAAPKNLGRLRLSSDPPGATVLVDGKVQPHPTPTLIEGEVGATLHVGFRLDGYSDKETDVLVSEGERPFRAHLDQRDVPVREPEPEPEPAPVLAPQPMALEPPHVPKEIGHAKKVVTHEKEKQYVQAESPAPTGSGTVSVHVRPWAIVYVDGTKVRQTPVDNYSLTAGLHTVELVNDVLKKREKVTVELRNGGTEEVRRDWGK